MQLSDFKKKWLIACFGKPGNRETPRPSAQVLPFVVGGSITTLPMLDSLLNGYKKARIAAGLFH